MSKTVSLSRKRNWRLNLSSNIPLFIMAMPAIVYFICFKYIPMGGLVLAFKNFMPKRGIWGSPWVGLKNFEFMFRNQTFWLTVRNTLMYNIIFLVTSIIFPVALAIGINEVRSKKLSRIFQTTMIMPHFVSYIVVSVIMFAILSADRGMIGHLSKSMGKTPIAFYSQPVYWPYFITILHIWKGTGYTSIIYLGAITGISDEFYEAALIDGATKWQQIKFITLPSLKQMIIVMAILRIGSLFSSNFDLFYQVPLNSGQLYKVTNTIDVFVYNTLKDSMNVGLSSATSFVQSICGFVLVLTTNQVIRLVDKDMAMF